MIRRACLPLAALLPCLLAACAVQLVSRKRNTNFFAMVLIQGLVFFSAIPEYSCK